WPSDVMLTGKALLPGTVNAHCHTFQSLLRGLGDDLDFRGWRDRVLYPFSEKLDRAGIALGAAFAFAEMLLHGATTCVDFFYLHDSGNENAGAVSDAARRVGIRLVLARAMYDWEGAPRRYRETVADAARRTRELIAAHRGDATTRVQPAPHSPHGASSAMIRAGWEVAEAEQVPFHIHVAEGRDEGERTLADPGMALRRRADRARDRRWLDQQPALRLRGDAHGLAAPARPPPRRLGARRRVRVRDGDACGRLDPRSRRRRHRTRQARRPGRREPRRPLPPPAHRPPQGRGLRDVVPSRQRRLGARTTGGRVGAPHDRGRARAPRARHGADQGMVDLDGGPLSLEAVEAVARRGEEVRLAPGPARALVAGRRFVEGLAASATPIYGIT